MGDVTCDEAGRLRNHATLVGIFMGCVEDVLTGHNKVVRLGGASAPQDAFEQQMRSPIFEYATQQDYELLDRYCRNVEKYSQNDLRIASAEVQTLSPEQADVVRSIARLKIQERKLSIAVREDLIEEQDLLEIFNDICDDSLDPVLLERYRISLLADLSRRTRENTCLDNDGWVWTPTSTLS